MLDEAEPAFQDVLKNEEYRPALFNMGSLRYLKERYREASAFLERAERVMCEDPRILLALVKVHCTMEEINRAEAIYACLQCIDQALVEKLLS